MTVFKWTGELLIQSISNITNYNEMTGVGFTLIEKGQNFNAIYTNWNIKVLYNGRTDPVWSQPSLPYFAAISGM